MAGYTTNGLPVGTGSDLNATPLVAVDTNAPGGSAPQTVAIAPGVLPMYDAAITANPGGGKADATPLGYGVNVITVCATAANSVILPYAYPGACVFVRNNGAQAAQVFGSGTDTVESTATATGVSQAASKGKLYYGSAGSGDGSDAGNWVTLLGA